MRSMNDTRAIGGWTAKKLVRALATKPDDLLYRASGAIDLDAFRHKAWARIQTAQRLVERWGFDEALVRLRGYGR